MQSRYYNEFDLALCPEPATAQIMQPEDDSLVIGDLHGNALKMVWFLLAAGMATMNSRDYEKLKDIYFQGENEDIDPDFLAFSNIIEESLQIDMKGKKLCLIGDELADRGRHDRLTLCVMEKIQDHVRREAGRTNPAFEIVFSNHTHMFFDWLFKGGIPMLCRVNDQGRSIYPCAYNEQGKPVTASEEIRESVYKVYTKESFKLISYDYGKNGKLYIYTHAPFSLECISKLAREMGVKEANFMSRESLIKCIDEINRRFFDEVMISNNIDQYDLVDTYGVWMNPLEEGRLRTSILWNRFLDFDDRDDCDDLGVIFVNGHTSSSISGDSAYRINIDNCFGKPRSKCAVSVWELGYFSVPRLMAPEQENNFVEEKKESYELSVESVQPISFFNNEKKDPVSSKRQLAMPVSISANSRASFFTNSDQSPVVREDDSLAQPRIS